tara:strand:- start:704 stop:1312 length:609 start_codon:yes stop_codon:yes gene_type:complete
MADMGRQLNKGCPRGCYDKVYSMFFEFNKDHFASYEGKTVSQFMKSERKFLKNNKVAVLTRGHIFAVKNGKIEDWMSKNRRHRIEEIYVVERHKENVNYADYLARGLKLVERAVAKQQAKLEKKKGSFTTRVYNKNEKSFCDFKYTFKMVAKTGDVKVKFIRYADDGDWLDAFLSKYADHYTIDADVQRNSHKLPEVIVYKV